jgi:PhzF family phenazine biosynthesis protein
MFLSALIYVVSTQATLVHKAFMAEYLAFLHQVLTPAEGARFQHRGKTVCFLRRKLYEAGSIFENKIVHGIKIIMETNNVIGPTKISNTAQAPQYMPVKENEQVLLALGISADHIAALPMIVNTGDSFLLLEMRNREALEALQPDTNGMRLLAKQYGLCCYCVFIRGQKDTDAIARVVDTRLEPAPGSSAGMAAGALACYLYDIAMVKQENMVIRQTPAAAGPSLIQVRLALSNGKIQSWVSDNGERSS